MSQVLDGIEGRINKIKNELMKIGEMRPGSLKRQYRGTAKNPYGQYRQLSYTHQGRSRSEYVRDVFVDDVKSQVAAYQRFRKLVSIWTTLAIRHARAKMKQEISRKKSG